MTGECWNTKAFKQEFCSRRPKQMCLAQARILLEQLFLIHITFPSTYSSFGKHQKSVLYSTNSFNETNLVTFKIYPHVNNNLLQNWLFLELINIPNKTFFVGLKMALESAWLKHISCSQTFSAWLKHFWSNLSEYGPWTGLNLHFFFFLTIFY